MTGKSLYTESKIIIQAKTKKIWDVLTNPDKTVQYMYGCKVDTSWTVGDAILWIGAKDNVTYVKGYVVKVEPERVLTYSVIDPEGEYEDIPENYLEVTYSLSTQGDNTLLVVRQGNYAIAANGDQRYKDSLAQGGWQSVLEKIKEIAES